MGLNKHNIFQPYLLVLTKTERPCCNLFNLGSYQMCRRGMVWKIVAIGRQLKYHSPITRLSISSS